MNDKRSFLPPAVGISSLLVIFAVLCITVFALLSMSTVRADGRLSESSAKAVEGYYEADFAAEEILARLRAGEQPEGIVYENGIYTYACPISETQALLVEVKVEGSEYTVLRWQARSTAEWELDDSLPVWAGGKGG